MVTAILLTLSACGGGNSGGGASGSSTVFEGQSACSAIGLSSSLKISNGQICPVSERSDTTSIVEVNLVLGSSDDATCSGTVISPTAVLTAAHCLAYATSIAISTVVNGVKTTKGVQGTFIHPSFTIQAGHFIGDDVGIIRTTGHMAAPASPLLLSRSAQKGEDALIAGFGSTSVQSSPTGAIYAGRAVVQEISDSHIRIDFNSDQAHPCFGDSGGPLFLQDDDSLAIAGIVSKSAPDVSQKYFCQKGDKTLK